MGFYYSVQQGGNFDVDFDLTVLAIVSGFISGSKWQNSPFWTSTKRRRLCFLGPCNRYNGLRSNQPL